MYRPSNGALLNIITSVSATVIAGLIVLGISDLRDTRDAVIRVSTELTSVKESVDDIKGEVAGIKGRLRHIESNDASMDRQ